MYHSVTFTVPEYDGDSPHNVINVQYEANRPSLPDYRLTFGRASSVVTYMDTAQAEHLALMLVETMFDNGTMSDKIARRISHYAGIIVDDPHEAMAAAADAIDDEGW